MNVDAIATDSGGIQEEGVSLNRPVFVLRNETDRPEGLSGTAVLVGTQEEAIREQIDRLMGENIPLPKNPFIYGDGQAAKRIALIVKSFLCNTLRDNST